MKKIKLSQEDRNKILEELINTFKEQRNIEETFTFQKNLAEYFKVDAEKAIVNITREAYLQMVLYTQLADVEIAWHGTVTKNDNVYTIDKVYLFPQTVTAVTVETDDVEYSKWLDTLDDETFNKNRFQGHSHVNMGVTPSQTDITYYNAMLNNLQEDDFYIFMILNKKGDTNWFIYDLEKNIYYKKDGIIVNILNDENESLKQSLVKEMEEFVKKPAPVTPRRAGFLTQGYHHGYGIVNNYNPFNTKEPYTETDAIFDELDQKYTTPKSKYLNSTIRTPNKKKRSTKHYGFK